MRELSIQGYADSTNTITEIDLADARPNPEGFFHLKQIYTGIEGFVEVLPKRLRMVAELRFLQETLCTRDKRGSRYLACRDEIATVPRPKTDGFKGFDASVGALISLTT